MTTILQWATVLCLAFYMVTLCTIAARDSTNRADRVVILIAAALVQVCATYQLAVAMGWVTR